MSDTWFILPNGDAANELFVAVPVKGPIKVTAEEVADRERLRDKIREHADKQKWHVHYDRLGEQLASVLQGYENIASNALAGAENVRDDMLTYLRSVVFVLETVVGEHLNHSQKNERIRGTIAVLEKHIHSLREEKFDFEQSTWRRNPDLFRWNERERHLREKVKTLQEQLRQAEVENDVPEF